MTLPSGVRTEVEDALRQAGLGSRITGAHAVGGGCIAHATRIETDRGGTLFLKWRDDAPEGFFAAEADGLRALAQEASLRVPDPLGLGGGGSGPSWLVMEHVAPGPPAHDGGRALGEGLARLHARTRQGFGWDRDNWIGSLPQTNTAHGSWPSFWRDLRLAPQLRRARENGCAQDTAFDRVLDLVPTALADIETPELLHGDLWSGNAYDDVSGRPVLIDPAVYAGHGEVDLAMTELFGGFGRELYDAYAHHHGITEAYGAYRRDLYQLYYLLVHANLFGASYEPGALRAAERVVAELDRAP